MIYAALTAHTESSTSSASKCANMFINSQGTTDKFLEHPSKGKLQYLMYEYVCLTYCLFLLLDLIPDGP